MIPHVLLWEHLYKIFHKYLHCTEKRPHACHVTSPHHAHVCTQEHDLSRHFLPAAFLPEAGRRSNRTNPGRGWKAKHHSFPKGERHWKKKALGAPADPDAPRFVRSQVSEPPSPSCFPFDRGINPSLSLVVATVGSGGDPFF